MSLNPNIKTLKLLADETRIKILRIAREGEFTVNEFVEILSLHQSNISRHLNQLKESNLLSDRKEGNLNFYRCSESLKADFAITNIIESAFIALGDSSSVLNFTQQILNDRKNKSKTFFDEIAGKYRNLAEPGGGFEGLFEAFASLIKIETAVDLGCGEGELALKLAPNCKTIYAVDLSEEMLKFVQQKATLSNVSNLITKRGDLESLPLPDNHADLVILSQVLHHASNPEKALIEALRILKPKGRLLLLDLQAHNFEWMREQMGDLWLGFTENKFNQWAQDFNLSHCKIKTIDVKQGLPLLLMIAQKEE